MSQRGKGQIKLPYCKHCVYCFVRGFLFFFVCLTSESAYLLLLKLLMHILGVEIVHLQ